MITPLALQRLLPLSEKVLTHILHYRQQFIDILTKKDNRLVVVVGPCSIHDTESALIYAEKLQKKIDDYRDTLCIIMRAYVEKSRTTTGWKGLVNDPDLNNTFSIETGLLKARAILREINAFGVPTATEIVNPLTTPFFLDLMSVAAIGARTVESQIHREFTSLLPFAVGFKNNTAGNMQVAIDGVMTAAQPHHFLGCEVNGHLCTQQSSGNPHGFVILRGANDHSNYDMPTISRTINTLKKMRAYPRVMIDCSHGNSQKNHLEQLRVLNILANRIEKGDTSIFGVMIESHLNAGKQAWKPGGTHTFGQSITDACISWEDTESALNRLHHAVQKQQARPIQSSLDETILQENMVD